MNKARQEILDDAVFNHTCCKANIFMRASLDARRGMESPGNIHTSVIEQEFRDEPSGRSSERLHVVSLRKQGKSENTIREMPWRGRGAISRWPNRMERDGIGAMHSNLKKEWNHTRS